MRSLFVVSLPRSLSSIVYLQVRLALGLAEPSWTSDGEILNVDRFALLPGDASVEGLRFLRRDRDRRRFDRLVDFVDQVVQREGFAYKDVVQPFVMAAWLAGSGLATLKIERPVTDIAYAMLLRGWDYPRAAAETDGGSPEQALIGGLLMAQRAFDSIPGPVVRFDELIFDEAPLQEVVGGFDGGDRTRRVAYLDDNFRAVREEVLARRTSERYRRLDAIRRSLEESL